MIMLSAARDNVFGESRSLNTHMIGTEWPFMCRCAVKKLLTHSEASHPLTSGLFAKVYLCEMVAVPPRIEFSIIRYTSGSVRRSNSSFVCLSAFAQANDGKVMIDEVETVQVVSARYRLLKMFKHICKQEDVRQQVMVVILLHVLHVVFRPYHLHTVVVFTLEQFSFQALNGLLFIDVPLRNYHTHSLIKYHEQQKVEIE